MATDKTTGKRIESLTPVEQAMAREIIDEQVAEMAQEARYERDMEAMYRDAHELLPASIAATIPALYATEDEVDPTCHVKLFTPDGQWTYWVIEYDPRDRLAFGLVEGFEAEMGYFSLDELEDARGPLGLPVERDLWWAPTVLSEVRAGLAGGPVVKGSCRF